MGLVGRITVVISDVQNLFGPKRSNSGLTDTEDSMFKGSSGVRGRASGGVWFEFHAVKVATRTRGTICQQRCLITCMI